MAHRSTSEMPSASVTPAAIAANIPRYGTQSQNWTGTIDFDVGAEAKPATTANANAAPAQYRRRPFSGSSQPIAKYTASAATAGRRPQYRAISMADRALNAVLLQ
jgi:hypothetical protein